MLKFKLTDVDVGTHFLEEEGIWNISVPRSKVRPSPHGSMRISIEGYEKTMIFIVGSDKFQYSIGAGKSATCHGFPLDWESDKIKYGYAIFLY